MEDVPISDDVLVHNSIFLRVYLLLDSNLKVRSMPFLMFI